MRRSSFAEQPLEPGQALALHIDPAAVRRTVEEVLDPLELAVRRLAAAR